MASRRVLRQIESAALDRRLVTVRRRKGWERLDGAVVAYSRTWLLLASEREAGFDGWILLRVADVTRIDERPSASFVPRALEREGRWPLPRLEGVDLSSTRAAVLSLAASADLLGFHEEHDRPHAMDIGVPARAGKKKVRLLTVDPDAVWDPVEVVVRYRSLTRIDVGNAYEVRLAAVAGPPPRPT